MVNISNNMHFNLSRVLIYSQRNIYKKYHYRCYLAEFEDLICQIDSVDLVAPTPKKYFEYSISRAKKLKEAFNISMNPGIPIIKLNREYDLFFAFCQFPHDLLNLQGIVGWKDKCKA